jgi:hypothetical protein
MMRKLTAILALAFGALFLNPALAAEPIATVETNWDGISLDVMALKRKGSVLTLKWAVRNEGLESTEIRFALKSCSRCKQTYHDIKTYIVDEESGTKYYVLADKEGNAVATSSATFPYPQGGLAGIRMKIAAGKSARLWMKLPAPPPEVQVVTVFFNEAVEPLEDVPITDK